MRVLNQDTASVLARVEGGETVEITRRGRVIGRIVPPAGGELDDLIADGRIIPASAKRQFRVPRATAGDESDAADLIRSLRDEERF
jgi:antitoxin (DNA-binding transcriptional repressor) of toxin-antitoxin stability system